MKSSLIPSALVSAAALALALTPLHAADVDTTPGITLNSSGSGNKYIGNGTLTVNDGSTVALGTGSGSPVTEFAMTGGLINIVAGTTLRNGGWQKGLWTNNQAAMQVDGSFDIWDGNPVTVDALTGSGTVVKGNSGGTPSSLTVGINNSSGTFSGTIGNALGHIAFTKTGSGTQTLTGANTYTGATIIHRGVLNLGGNAATGSLSSSSPLVMAGGALAYTRTGNTTQEFTTTSISSGASTLSAVTGNTLNLGTVTRTPGATVNLDRTPGSGTIQGSATLLNSILRWATVSNIGTSANLSSNGFTFATVTGGVIVPFTTVNSLPSFAWTSSNDSSWNYDLTATSGTTLGVSRTANSVRYVGAADGNQPFGATLTLNALMNASARSLTLSGSGALAIGSSNELILAAAAGPITIAKPITGASGALTKTGANTVTLSATNSYTGATTVNAGTLILGNGTNNTGLSDSAAVSIGSDAILQLNYLPANIDTIDQLFLGGVQAASGTWGSLASSATHKSALITGSGLLNVSSHPRPTYHVSTSGSDAASGSAATPFATLAKAASLVRAGDLVLVTGGTYIEKSITPAVSGNEGSYIFFKPAPGTGDVIIKHPATSSTGEPVFQLGNRNHIWIEGFTFKDSVYLGPCIRMSGSQNNVVVNNRFENLGNSGVESANSIISIENSAQNVVSNNYFQDVFGDAVGVSGSQFNLVSHNTFIRLKGKLRSWGGPYLFSCAVGVRTKTYGFNVVALNYSEDLSHNVWLDRNGSRNIILRNFGKLGSTNVFNESRCTENIVQENISVNMNAGYMSAYYDTGWTYDTRLVNNVSYNNTDGFVIQKSVEDEVRNNISYNNSSHNLKFMEEAFPGISPGAGHPGDPHVYRNNLWYSATKTNSIEYRGTSVSVPVFQSAVGESGGLSVDPKFTNPGAGDFSLQASSPAKGAADNGLDLGAFAAYPPTPYGRDVNLQLSGTLVDFQSSISSIDRNGTALIAVRLSEPSTRAVSVDVLPVAGDAVNGSNFTLSETTLVFQPGETSRTFTVSALGESEHDRIVAFTLNNPINALVGPRKLHVSDIRFAPQPQAEIWLEAEYGSVGSLWNVISDPLASSNGYVTIKPGTNSNSSAPLDPAGHLTFTFDVTDPGMYTLYARTICPSASDDSFWLRMDNGSFSAWDGISRSSSWVWAEHDSPFPLSSGTHTLTVAYREDGARLDKLYLTKRYAPPSEIGAQAGNSGYQENGGMVSMEAEHGTLGSHWMTGADMGASGGKFIEPLYHNGSNAPAGVSEEYRVSYHFNVINGGNYRFWFRMHSSSPNDDSFFWRIDGGSWIMENSRSGIGSWFSSDHIQVDALSAGGHVLEIAYREDGTRLDKFVIQLDSLAAPSGNGPAESFRSAPVNYAAWRNLLPPGLRDGSSDGNGDGVSNLEAYALGHAANDILAANPSGLYVQGTASSMEVGWLLPSDAPDDVTYEIEYSDDLTSSWNTLSSKRGNGAWAGWTVPVVTPGIKSQHKIFFDPSIDTKGFYRLKFSNN